MRSNNKRPKPFVSKQTRHITGKKNKPGHPTFPRQVEGEKQFYLFGYVFSTKKELKDRVKQLLRAHHSLTNNFELSAPDLTNGQLIKNPFRPDPPGGLIKRLQENNDKIKSILFKPPSNVTSINIDTFSSPTVFSLLQQLVLRHPNYEAWSNKNIVFFTVSVQTSNFLKEKIIFFERQALKKNSTNFRLFYGVTSKETKISLAN